MPRTRFSPKLGHRFGSHPAFVSAAAGTVTANTTTTHFLPPIHRKAYLFRASAVCQTVPADADGTLLATLKKWDASADAAVTLSSALDLEALTAKESSAFTLSTSLTEAQRRIDEGDSLYVEVVSNSAAIDTAAVNLKFTVEVGVIE